MDDAKDREYRFLKQLQVHKNPMYINMAIMGKSFCFDRSGMKHSDETIKKLRVVNSRKHTQETKDKISKANTGVVRDSDYKANVSKVHKGKIESEKTKLKKSLSHIGKKHSPETLKKLSENSGRAKEVEINKTIYKSIKIAAEELYPDLPYYTGVRMVKKHFVSPR